MNTIWRWILWWLGHVVYTQTPTKVCAYGEIVQINIWSTTKEIKTSVLTKGIKSKSK
jgi:hypothetical protein